MSKSCHTLLRPYHCWMVEKTKNCYTYCLKTTQFFFSNLKWNTNLNLKMYILFICKVQQWAILVYNACQNNRHFLIDCSYDGKAVCFKVSCLQGM